MQTCKIHLEFFSESELLRMIVLETCICVKIPGMRVELFGGEVSVTSVGLIYSVWSLLLILDFEITEVVCV